MTTQDLFGSLIKNQRIARDLVFNGKMLTEIELSNLRADGIDFIEVDLTGARLTEVKWNNCSLRESRLESADLSNATLRICDLFVFGRKHDEIV